MNSVERLSFDDYLEGIDKVVLPSFPSKQLTEIVRLVNDGRSDEISIFEWLDVIEDTKQWDAVTEDVFLAYEGTEMIAEKFSSEIRENDQKIFRIVKA